MLKTPIKFTKKTVLKKYSFLLILIFNLFVYQKNRAQSRSNYENEWLLGIGFNTVMDSGDSLNELFNFKESYHFSVPFKISIEKKINSFQGVELRGTTNTYKKSKKFNEGILSEDISFRSIDLSYKYYFFNRQISHYQNKIFGYGSAGFGKSWFGKVGDSHLHLGAGLNYKVHKNIMLSLQSIGKLSISEDVSNNYIQVDFGAVIPLNFF